MLQSLLWDDEVREADFPSLDEDVRVSAKEAEMASSLVENMSADFAPEKFSDEYQAQLRELIAAKLEQGDALDTAATFGEEDAGEARGRSGSRPDGRAAAQRGGEPVEARLRLGQEGSTSEEVDDQEVRREEGDDQEDGREEGRPRRRPPRSRAPRRSLREVIRPDAG